MSANDARWSQSLAGDSVSSQVIPSFLLFLTFVSYSEKKSALLDYFKDQKRISQNVSAVVFTLPKGKYKFKLEEK